MRVRQSDKPPMHVDPKGVDCDTIGNMAAGATGYCAIWLFRTPRVKKLATPLSAISHESTLLILQTLSVTCRRAQLVYITRVLWLAPLRKLVPSSSTPHSSTLLSQWLLLVSGTSQRTAVTDNGFVAWLCFVSSCGQTDGFVPFWVISGHTVGFDYRHTLDIAFTTGRSISVLFWDFFELCGCQSPTSRPFFG